MKTFSILIILFCTIQLSAQQISKQQMTGIWVCTKVAVDSTMRVSAEERAPLETMKKAFINSTFKFGADGLFKLDLPEAKLEVTNSMEFLKNKKWFFNEKTNTISIGPPAENLMHIKIVSGDGFVHFFITDIPLILRMVKQQP
jgi:hypothetical protein